MNTLLLITNEEAARTLTLIAFLVLFFIIFNLGIFIYTIIRNKIAASKSKAVKLDQSHEQKTEEKSEKPAAKPAAKPFSMFKKSEKKEGFELVLTDIAHPERAFYVEGKTEYLAGRRPQMDLCIPDDGYVSGTHCKFEFEEGVLFVTDLESSNGTKVNGTKITERTKLSDNDIVRIGKVEYRVNY